MELVFDMVSAPQPLDGSAASKTFRLAGGIIGRAEGCDWVLPDRNRVVSGKHAMVTFDNGAFYLTDTSSNGIHLKDSGMPMVKGEPVRIEHGQVFCLGDYQIRARLRQDPSEFDSALPHSQSTGNIIPDDAFLDLDPLNALDQQEERQYRDELSWGCPLNRPNNPTITLVSIWSDCRSPSWFRPRPRRSSRPCPPSNRRSPIPSGPDTPRPWVSAWMDCRMTSARPWPSPQPPCSGNVSAICSRA